MNPESFADMLAKDEGFGLLQFIFFAVIFGLSVLGSIFAKKKESDEKARRQNQPPQGSARPQQQARQARPQPHQRPDEGQAGAVEALRQALGWTQPSPRQTPPPLPAPRGGRAGRPSPPPARPMHQPTPRRASLDVAPPMAHHETVGEHQLHAPMDMMDVEGPVRDAGAIGRVAQTASAPGHALSVPLHNPADVRRGIIYAEILGPPKALRRGPDPWEL